ncbi:MAG: phosphoesterase [Desulfurococcales archaeon]|nr:phosphoesterase [Desulfurococcales archaeon]MEB3772750.1 phosphoesterase [Desulfurococcales archaeon]MEB3799176.1 phosphoesterase [Desulfurococcales archaeon]
MGECRVVAIGDWDADGTVAAALVKYAQRVLKSYPVKGECSFESMPAGPRSIDSVLKEVECPTVLMILDIPFTPNVKSAIEEFRGRCGDSRIIYIDHHRSTIVSSVELEDNYRVEVITGVTPTSILLYNILRSLGLTLTPRLKEFSKAIGILEHSSRYIDENVSKKMVDLAASISKTLNVEHDPQLWQRFVDWLASPLPFDEFKFKPKSIKAEAKVEVKDLSQMIADERDKELKELSRELAMSAQNLGYIKLVDARKKWRKRGATALASKIYGILRSPVALLVSTSEGYTLLIVRANRGLAQRIVDYLDVQGAIVDKGGHGNIAMARLRDDISIEKLKSLLRRAVVSAM